MSKTTCSGAELHKFFNNTVGTADSAWEKVLLENAQRVSTPLATRLLSQMGLDTETATPFRVLENACGVAVAAPVLQRLVKSDVLRQSSIVCGDSSEKVVEIAKKRIEAGEWVGTTAAVVDAQRTQFSDGAFTHVATNIGFHVVPDSEAALDEAIRVLQPGGVLGLTTWHRESSLLHDVKEAFKSFPFEAPCHLALQTTAWGEWSDVNWIRKTLVSKGLQNVEVDVYAFLNHVDGADFFIEQFGGMMDWMMASGWPEDLRKQHPKEEVHQMVKEFLEKKYGGDGWDISWFAIIASGRTPSRD